MDLLRGARSILRRKKVDKKFCIGCDDDFFNGKNPHGIPECCCLKDAKRIKRRRVGISERPPWRRIPELFPFCYKQKGFIFVAPDQEK